MAETDLIATSYNGSSSTLGSNFRRRLRIKAKSLKGEKILPSNALPCLVGMGVVLAGAPGLPSMAPMCGVMAIEQGRRKPQGKERQPLEGSGMQMMKQNGEEGDSDEEVNANGRGILDDDEEEANDEDDEDEDEIDDNGKVKVNGDYNDGSRERGNHEKREGRRGEQHGALRNFRDLSISTHTSPSILQTEYSKRTASLDHPGNPLSQFTTGFNELKDKATAAVNDVFGQMAVDFAPGTRTKSQNKAIPLWHAQSKRMKSPHAQDNRRSSEYRGHRVNASVPNLINSARNSTSSSPFGSSVTLAEDGQSLTPEAILSRYDTEARRRLLRSNYCRKQTSFLQTLQDISARLLILPKPARLSALRAELTELNHTLPAEVCFPMWCRAEMRDGQETSDASKSPMRKSRGKSGRHHRVVRINPSEAVVLNSADRVPYLLHVEVLVDDLDFDTERRQNRESLKKLVMQEEIRRRKTAISRQLTGSGQLSRGSRSDVDVSESMDKSETTLVAPDSSGLTPSLPSHDQAGSPLIVSPKVQNEEGRFDIQQPSPIPTQGMPEESAKSPFEEGEDGEEIDLTEQAYGHDLSGFGEEKEEDSSDEEDLARMNVLHDNAAWAQAQVQRSKAQINGLTSPTSKSANHRKTTSISANNVPANKKKDFSLDEYAERMRTAAIMLAQLNQSTNASAHPMVASNPHVSSTAQGGWSSWVIGTSWATTTAQPGKKSEAGQGSAGVNAPISVAAAGGGQTSTTLIAGGSSTLGMPLTAANRSGSTSSRLVHTDTESIRKRIMQEMMALEEERMERMKVSGNRKNKRGAAGNAGVEDEMTIQRAVNKDDPSAAMFRESWSAKKQRIRASSPYGHFDNWDVFSVIVKTGADLRQEQLAVQLIQEFGRIWQETGSRCWIRYFKILVTSENSGIMETITDAVSVHSIKKEAYSRHQSQDGKIATYSLLDHFINTFGDPSSSRFNKARQNFLESLAAYSIISYLLHLKDRHNGNLLIDQDGHLIHIDFGYMLGISPGGVGFEAAPFKMPQEYLDILGGVDSAKFAEFKTLVCQGFRDVRKHAERIIMMVELMQKDSKLPCFALGEMTSNYLRDRFQLALSHSQCDEFVDRLVMNSLNSTFTRLYDQYQYYSEGILS